MWNNIHTGQYEGMLAETVTVIGYNGEKVNAYYSRPLGAGHFPSIVLIPHMPGWDEFSRETARRLTQHGYLTICPDIYSRFGQGSPDEIAAKARAAGGVSDDSVMGDCRGALDFIVSQPYSGERAGIIGVCSGGRHAFLASCRLSGFDAAVDCWGGGVVMKAEELSPSRPVAPIDYISSLSCPLLGIFGNEDRSPSPEQVNLLEETLQKHGKDYEFHRYDGAGHGIWYYHNDRYRPQQAMDSWEKVFTFFEKHLK